MIGRSVGNAQSAEVANALAGITANVDDMRAELVDTREDISDLKLQVGARARALSRERDRRSAHAYIRKIDRAIDDVYVRAARAIRQALR